MAGSGTARWSVWSLWSVAAPLRRRILADLDHRYATTALGQAETRVILGAWAVFCMEPSCKLPMQRCSSRRLSWSSLPLGTGYPFVVDAWSHFA